MKIKELNKWISNQKIKNKMLISKIDIKDISNWKFDSKKIYNENKIDIGIFDISIPGMNGLNLTSKIREIDEKIEIIIISAYSDKEKLLKAVSLKLFTYLIKPVVLSDLKSTIQTLINKKSYNDNIKFQNNYVWNTQTKTLFYKTDSVKITQNEMGIIDILLNHKNRYLTACQIQELLYNETILESDSCKNMVKLLSRFKKKLNILHQNDEFFIENCYGIGYKILL